MQPARAVARMLRLWWPMAHDDHFDHFKRNIFASGTSRKISTIRGPSRGLVNPLLQKGEADKNQEKLHPTT